MSLSVIGMINIYICSTIFFVENKKNKIKKHGNLQIHKIEKDQIYCVFHG